MELQYVSVFEFKQHTVLIYTINEALSFEFAWGDWLSFSKIVNGRRFYGTSFHQGLYFLETSLQYGD